MSRASQFFSLEPERALLNKLGDPHMKLKFVHVAGTNGKGSTCAYIASILKYAGYKVGCFTSPFFCVPNEMIRINDKAISGEEFDQFLSRIESACDELQHEGIEVSDYEKYTALAFLYFWHKECDIVVAEVCMGGSVDCTNVIPAPLVTVMVPISYDHMGMLGDTLYDIASEKAGIIKTGSTVVSAPQEDEVRSVLDEICKQRNVPIRYVDLPETISHDLGRQVFRTEAKKAFDAKGSNDDIQNGIGSKEVKNAGKREYETSLLGIYQPQNAVLALGAIEALCDRGFVVSEGSGYNGIKNTQWFGRFTVIQNDPPVIVDGGHNKQGAKVLRESLEAYFPGVKITFILGILKDKEVDMMLDILLPIAKEVYCTAVPNERTMDPGELEKKIQKKGISAHVISGITEYQSIAKPSEVTCIAGSLYLLGEVYKQQV